jgi:glycosyltransferase involved in cell wall biosynthesis
VTERIVDYAGDFCEEQVDLYLRSQSEQNALMTILKEVEVRLGLLFEDKRQAARYIDSAIRDYVIKESRAVIVNAQSKAVVLLDLLLKLEYKQSAAHLLSQIVGILGNERKKKQLDKILTDKIIGDEKLLEENAIYSFSNKKSNNKNRIMFCSTHWLTGGMERVLSLVFEQLKEKYEIYLFTPSDGRAYEIKLPNYVNHVKISNAVFYKDFDFAALTAAILLRVDVLVGFYNLFEKQLNLYSLCNSEGIKTVASNHEYFYYPYLSYDFQDLAIKRLDAFKKVDAVLWPTNFSAAACALGCENSYLMPNPNTFTVTNVSEKEKENIIICAGRFNDYIKRIDRILQCFKIVQDRLPNSKLMIVGDCDRQKKNELFGGKTINDIIIDLGLDENNLIFTGNVSNMADYYKQAKVLVLASGSEGFGMVINEAASFGVPTVYNYIPGLEDLVTNGKNGFVVEQDDISTMAEKLVIILTDKKVFTKLSAGATQLVKRFDAITIGQRWTYLIDNLLEHRDSSNLHKSLRNKLSYTISDQKQFSKIIFSEFDRTTRKLVGLNSTSTVAVGSPSYLERFARSLRVNGRKRTIRKILGRVYKRIKSNT